MAAEGIVFSKEWLDGKGLKYEVFLLQVMNRFGSDCGGTRCIATGIGDFLAKHLAQLRFDERPGTHVL